MLENLETRLNYHGGKIAEDRFIKDKLKTLKKALLYSYQAATAVLADGREFRCLINPDKLKNDYEDKILSIPYEDICLNAEKKGTTSKGIEPIGIKPGDVFLWKETNSYWLVYLQYLEEDAYFRAEIRKCIDEEIDVNGKKYRPYIRGPVETTIPWKQKKGIVWNEMNYSLVMYITKDENTTNFFHRFTIIEIGDKPYEVQVVNAFTESDGILIVYLDEYFQNSIQKEEEQSKVEVEKPEYEIMGEWIVSPYDKVSYSIDDSGGKWMVSNSKAKIIDSTDKEVLLEIVTGRSGSFDLIYRKNGQNKILPITIKSL